MKKDIRVGVLSPLAGTVVGGIETVARELKTNLPFRTEVFSILPSDWTWGVGSLSFYAPSQQLWIGFVRKSRLWLLNQLIPRKYILAETSFLEYQYVRGLREAFDRFSPSLLINPQGPIVASFLNSYRREKGVPFLCVGENGRSLWERRSAQAKPDAYIALTPDLHAYMKRRVPGVRIEMIPNGVNRKLFSPEGERFSPEDVRRMAKKSTLPKPPFVVSTSRFVREKRIDIVMRAMQLWGKGSLIAAGGGKDREELARLGEELLGPRFFYLGDRPYAELPKLYRMGHIFALASKAESFGNVMIEAMACGLPVVSCRDANREWIVGQRGGILVEGSDPALFASALSKALQTEWRDGPLGESARFDWRSVANQYAWLIEEILSSQRPEA